MAGISLYTIARESKSFFTAEILTCGLLGKLLINEPQSDWLHSLAQDQIFDEIPLGINTAEVKQGSTFLQDWQSEYIQDHSGGLHAAMVADYTRLFIGPGKVLAPPWESVYKTKERLIFQEQTLDVRNWYHRFGLESERLYQEPDDHIGLELIFLAHLANLGLEAANNQHDGALEEAVSAQWQFLRQHPLSWAHLWCADVLEFGRTDFYRGVALLVKGVLHDIQATFENLSGVN